MLSDYLNGKTIHVSAHIDNLLLSYLNGVWTPVYMPSPRGISKGSLLGIACGDGVRAYRSDGTLGALYPFNSNVYDAHGAVYLRTNFVFASSANSCLEEITVNGQVNIWQTPGVSVSTDHRSHINGVCIKNGVLGYVTALALSNTANNGWKTGAQNSHGVLIDAQTKTSVLSTLFMPHSPVWNVDRVWFLNSGHGQLCYWKPGDAAQTVVATLTGFSRGLCFLDATHVAIGISQGRITAFPNLTINTNAQPGIAIVDITTGKQVFFEPMDIEEIFDISYGFTPLVA